MEGWAPLPARPRGFLRTVRELRLAAAVAPPGTESLSVRLAYEQALGRLPPTDALNGARQWGDGVALRLRLGDLAAAEAVARDGMRLFPGDHRLAALLGAVCHSREDWAQAERALSVAFALAASQPERLLDRDHLAWVRSRARGSGVWRGELAGRWKGKEGLAGAQALCLRVPTDPLLPVLVAARCRALGDAHAALATFWGMKPRLALWLWWSCRLAAGTATCRAWEACWNCSLPRAKTRNQPANSSI